MDKLSAMGITIILGSAAFVASDFIPIFNICCFINGLIIGSVMILMYSKLMPMDTLEYGTTVLICGISSTIGGIIATLMTATIIAAMEPTSIFGIDVGGPADFVNYIILGLITWFFWITTSIIGAVITASFLTKKA
jgi:hypothetical protein